MILVGDFETTVYEGQESTEVWASALVELNTENVLIFHSLPDTYSYITSLPDKNIVIYYHNLKFDGAFWLDYLINVLHMKQAIESQESDGKITEFSSTQYMKKNTFKYVISELGQWYSITIKTDSQLIEIRDSLKLLPFSVKKIGKSFGTKHKKLDMEYTGFRYAGCTITDEEKKYIANDVLVVKEALEIMFSQGHTKLTIGSCCLAEYKKIVGKEDYDMLFPDLSVIPLDKEIYGAENVDQYIRRSYKGGWCYVVKGKENKKYHKGITADVNSLYPSVMSSESGSRYPYGVPKFWRGNYIPDEAKKPNMYYFVRIRTRFYLRTNRLPCIQIKGNFHYNGNDWLESSDVYDFDACRYTSTYIDLEGVKQTAYVTLTLTMTDFQLIKEQYELVDCEILDGCYFYSLVGLFDDYIYPYKKIKQESTGAIRELAKLFLNNLYGKMASSTDSSFKVAYDDDGVIKFYPVTANNKKIGYIPVGSAITSYARNFTIRSAQANYYGADKRGFIYADTDSIHCDLEASELKGIKVHDTEFCHWKLESTWDEAIFVRQKTYIEHVIEENLKPVEEPYYNVKCAGMPEQCKKNFLAQMKDISEFKVGLKLEGKLLPKRIKGGIVLQETTYIMR